MRCLCTTALTAVSVRALAENDVTLLRLLIGTFAPQGALVFGLDDTIERRRGDEISAKGIYRNPVRSSHSQMGTTADPCGGLPGKEKSILFR